jgi:hypothetical protein
MLSSSSLQIEFDRDSAIYYGSELLSGLVHFTTNEAHLEHRQLSIELCGEATYEELVGNGNEERREIKAITFLFDTVGVNEPYTGHEQSSVSNGRSSWPFEIELPKYAPPIFEIRHILRKNHPASQYSITARLQRSL